MSPINTYRGHKLESKLSFSSTSMLTGTNYKMKFILTVTFIAATSAVIVEKRERISSISPKKHGKRGAFSVEYGYPSQEPAQVYEAPNQQISHGYDYAHPEPVQVQPVGVPVLHPVPVPHPVPEPQPVPVPHPVPVIHTIIKHVPVDRPVSVPVDRLVPVPVDRPVPVPVDRPVPVPVPKPYPVHIEKIVHVPIEKTVHVDRPYAVPVAVPKPYPVPVEKYIHIDRPYPVHVAVPVHVPKPYPVPVAIHTQYKPFRGW